MPDNRNRMSSLLAQFQSLLNSGPVDVVSFLSSNSDSGLEEQLQVILLDMSHRWQTNNPKLVEEYLEALPDLARIPTAMICTINDVSMNDRKPGWTKNRLSIERSLRELN